MPGYAPTAPIAILRLDGDWYDSTMVYPGALLLHLPAEEVVIVDDYSAWDGCRRVVSDYLYHWLWLLLLPSILPLSRRPGYLRAGKIKSEVRPLAGETVVCYGPAVQIQAWGISRPNDTRLICKCAT